MSKYLDRAARGEHAADYIMRLERENAQLRVMMRERAIEAEELADAIKVGDPIKQLKFRAESIARRARTAVRWQEKGDS